MLQTLIVTAISWLAYSLIFSSYVGPGYTALGLFLSSYVIGMAFLVRA